MVDLRASGLKLRPAAIRAAEEVRTGDAPSAETLRKHYRELEACGQLPPPSTSPEGRAKAMLNAFDQRFARIEEARRTLVSAENDARALGLDLSADLEALSVLLLHRLRDLSDFLNDSGDYHAQYFVSQGVSDPQEAARLLIEKHQERDLTEEQIKALREVRQLRDLARMRG